MKIKAITLSALLLSAAACQRIEQPKEAESGDSKLIIYQMLPRIFGNTNTTNCFDGNIQQNGCGKLNDITISALESIRELGVNHIWYTGIIDYATTTDYSAFNMPANSAGVVKGKAGSPYAIRNYYNVAPDLAVDVENRMQEFNDLVERTHQCGMKVIIDFVPNHVAREYRSDNAPQGVKSLGETDDRSKAFDVNNNFYYIVNEAFAPEFDIQGYTEFPAKATGNDQFTATPSKGDWYETIKLNYGIDPKDHSCHFDSIPSTWHKMKDILTFWASKGIDGFRADMAEMVPVEFWQWSIPQVKELFPDIIFIAEIYNPDSYRKYINDGHFDYLYDKVGLYDTLKYVIQGKSPASAIAQNARKQEDIQSHLLNFLENHDEQRIASPDFAGDALHAIPMAIVSAAYSSNPMMIYFAQELGEAAPEAEGFGGNDGRTTIFDYWSLESVNRWRNSGLYNTELLTPQQQSIRSFYQRLLGLCNSEKAISQGETIELDRFNRNNADFDSSHIFAFLRHKDNDIIICIANFGSAAAKGNLIVPPYVFEKCGIPYDAVLDGIDLLTDDVDKQRSFTSEKALEFEIPAFSGEVLRFRF